MKKVLLLAYDFPPYTAIGAARPNSWYKHLHENGIYPVVVTRHWDNDNNFKNAYISSSKVQEKTIENNETGALIRCPYKATFRDRLILKYGYEKFSFIRKSISFLQFLFAFPFFNFDNKKEIYKAAKEFLATENVDLIIATGEPFIMHKYAYLLSKQFNIPYMLDYRDGWTTRDDNLKATGFAKFLNNFYFRNFEKKYLGATKFVVTSNPFEQEKIKAISPNVILRTVFNGYVEAEIDLGKDVDQQSDIFRIGYAGTIYPYNRLEDFLEGMKKFVTEFPDAKLKLWLLGIDSQPLQLNRIKNYDKVLQPFIESTPRMDKAVLIQSFCKCNCLLILTNPDTRLLPSKIYEYLPLERKILVSVNDNSDLKMIMETTNGGYNCNNAEEIFLALKEMYAEFLATGKVKSTSTNYQQFSRRNQAKVLAEIIKEELN
jgi:glycosyltransferase involved in cell wall biosynthesis